MKEIMEAPVKQLPLDTSWDMGSCLSIYTEGKTGGAWGSMK
jgi:hypothetical protein